MRTKRVRRNVGDGADGLADDGEGGVDGSEVGLLAVIHASLGSDFGF